MQFSGQNQENSLDKCGSCNKSMARTKATVTRLPRPAFISAPVHRIGNKSIPNRRLKNAHS